jgi:cell division septum initiation protein DivIVA
VRILGTQTEVCRCGYEAQRRDERKEATSVDVKDLVEQLRSIVENARSMPMSSSAVINRGEVLALIADLEQALPAAFEQSNRVFSERDAMLADANERAARILEEANFERDRLVSDSDVYRIALREAEELRATAERECGALRHETDEYVDTRLANFEITLTKTLEAVTRGRDRLQGRHQLDQESLDSLAQLEDTGSIPPLPRH